MNSLKRSRVTNNCLKIGQRLHDKNEIEMFHANQLNLVSGKFVMPLIYHHAHVMAGGRSLSVASVYFRCLQLIVVERSQFEMYENVC